MTLDPSVGRAAPLATSSTNPPAIATFLRNMIIWIRSAKLLWKRSAVSSEKPASSVVAMGVRPSEDAGQRAAKLGGNDEWQQCSRYAS